MPHKCGQRHPLACRRVGLRSRWRRPHLELLLLAAKAKRLTAAWPLIPNARAQQRVEAEMQAEMEMEMEAEMEKRAGNDRAVLHPGRFGGAQSEWRRLPAAAAAAAAAAATGPAG